MLDSDGIELAAALFLELAEHADRSRLDLEIRRVAANALLSELEDVRARRTERALWGFAKRGVQVLDPEAAAFS